MVRVIQTSAFAVTLAFYQFTTAAPRATPLPKLPAERAPRAAPPAQNGHMKGVSSTATAPMSRFSGPPKRK